MEMYGNFLIVIVCWCCFSVNNHNPSVNITRKAVLEGQAKI